MFCPIGPIFVWYGNSSGCTAPSNCAVVRGATYCVAIVTGAVRIVCVGTSGGRAGGDPSRPPWNGLLRAKNCPSREILSSEVVMSAGVSERAPWAWALLLETTVFSQEISSFGPFAQIVATGSAPMVPTSYWSQEPLLVSMADHPRVQRW